jgi:hypothetical protein
VTLQLAAGKQGSVSTGEYQSSWGTLLLVLGG